MGVGIKSFKDDYEAKNIFQNMNIEKENKAKV